MRNLTRSLDFHARTRPDVEALIYDGSRLSWRELQDRVQRTAAGLADQGIGVGDVVALMMKNSAAFIEVLYALSHLGAVSLPINFRLSGKEVEYIVTNSTAKMVLADEEFSQAVGNVSAAVVLLDGAAQSDSTLIFGECGHMVMAIPRNGDDLFRLMYTSGTTGHPKGVMHSYDNFQWKGIDHAIVLNLTHSDRLLAVGPLYHVGACDLPGLGVHMMGGTIVVMRDFDAAATLGMIAKEQINGIWLAPVMMAGILVVDTVHDTTTLKWCIGGGEKTPEHRIRQFTGKFKNARYIDAYGMTESVSGDTFMEAGREIEKIGSVGRPVPHLVVEIRDDAGHSVGVGVEGEICLRGPKITSGYWQDPEKTAAAFHTDGFLRTGDVGYLDADGFLFLTDRKKDMIISGGENIASSEVERVIFGLDGVEDVAVIARNDEKWGEIPVAVIVPKAGAVLTKDDLDQHCRAQLAGFKCPKDLVIIDSLPRNPSGKVLKRVLRDLVTSYKSSD